MKNKSLIKEKSPEIKLLFGKSITASNSKEGRKERFKFYFRETRTFLLISIFLSVYRYAIVDQNHEISRRIVEIVTMTGIITLLFFIITIVYYEIRVWYFNLKNK
mgnify:FL=1